MAALVALIGGCGGGDEGTTTEQAGATGATTTATTSTEDDGLNIERGSGPQITVKVGFVTGPPADACRDFMTASYVRDAYGDVAGCTSSLQSGAFAQRVDIKSTERSGATATVRLVPTGGPNNGETLTVSLVANDDGVWQVDSVESNAPVGP